MRIGSVSRRRALTVLAGTAVGAVGQFTPSTSSYEWSGTALGADARIVLEGEGRVAPVAAIAECIAEIERLDAIFSLHRSDSELSRLNASGGAQLTSLDLRTVLLHCRALYAWTEGLFDPTVQPLWQFYAAWFAREAHRGPPPETLVAPLLKRIGFQYVELESTSVRLPPSCQLTLNGIAQGYITDRVTQILQARGWAHVLADVGEVRALGGKQSDAPFTIEVRESGLTLPCATAALATSAPAALLFTGDGAFTHILNPRTGQTTGPWRCITVRMSTATLADGLSTALALSTEDELSAITQRVGGLALWATRTDGSTLHAET